MTGTKLTLTIGAAALLLAACSSSGTTGKTPTNTTATHSAAAQPSAAAAAASSAPAAAGPLTGTWNGQYDGSYQGTFVLHWHQKGSKLGGRIHISNPSRSLAIHGSVAGGSIQFGTVGSTEITYSGTVSGGSMSGTYKVGGAGGGSWKASKG